MSEAKEIDFPLTVTFSKGQITHTFLSRQDLAIWLKDEQQFWQSLAPGLSNDGSTQSALTNREFIANLKADTDFLTLEKQFKQIQDQFIPATIGGGIYIRTLAKTNQQMARFVFSEIANPGSLGWPINNAVAFESKIIATIFRVVGNPPELLQGIAETNKQIEQTRASEGAVVRKFEALISQSEADWASRIDGYEAKVALKAPREYWEGRASKHEKLAKRARIIWNGSVVGFFALLGILSALLLSSLGSHWFPEEGNEIKGIISDLKRILMLGTFIGICIWWIRQKLKDLRSHEH